MRLCLNPSVRAWLLAGVSGFVLVMLAVAGTSQAIADDSPQGVSLSPTLVDEPVPLDQPAESTSTLSVASDQEPSTFQVIGGNEEASPAPNTPGVPTVADPQPSPATPQPAVPVDQTTANTAAPATKSSTAIEPIPEPDKTVPPKVETAGFNGVLPGRSTKAQVEKLWGQPKEMQTMGDMVIQQYEVKPFDRVEVAFTGDKVASIIIRLEKAFPVKAVAETLGLSNIRPVLVSNELGNILGQSYPERGVLFAFQQNKEQGSPSMKVAQIVLEPVSPDPFVLRAETNLQNNFEQNLHDLDEALKLAPNHARAHWLRARVLAAMGRSEEAVEASRKAIALEENNARFHVSYAQILNQAGYHKESLSETARAITMSDDRPHVKARAQCLMGDFLADGAAPDWANALKFHMAAAKTAEPLAKNRHPAIRLAAKEVLIDAHLGAANDIAWGNWGGKEKAVNEWTRRAVAYADELIANDGGNNEHRFRVASRTLGAYVGTQGIMDPTDWVREVVQVGNVMIDTAVTASEKQQMRWEVGMALFNAVQIYQARKQYDFALECGQQAANYLEPGKEGGTLLPEQEYLLGRLYFRLGAIHALNKSDHSAAIAWYDKAATMLGKPFSKTPDAELGRQGETLVSMGVSYWEAKQREKALQVTRAGLDMMLQAVRDGGMEKDALGVPYDNLATMQKHLGNEKEAIRMNQLAADARAKGTSDVQTGTAAKPGEGIRR